MFDEYAHSKRGQYRVMNKAKIIGQAMLRVGKATKHLRLYGMDAGVDSSIGVIREIIEWVYDEAQGNGYAPITEEQIKRKIKY